MVYVCLYNNTKIISFLWAKRSNCTMHIMSLWTDTNWRRKGMGKQLKVELEKWCVKTGIKTIETTVHIENKSMISLNKKLQYESKYIRMEKRL